MDSLVYRDSQRMHSPFHPAYFQTRFQSEHHPEIWPERFGIVTAYATTGEHWEASVNIAADQSLQQRIQSFGITHWRITGYSPETGHREPGWLVDMSLEQVCALGQEYYQDAIHYVQRDELLVVRCNQLHETAEVD